MPAEPSPRYLQFQAAAIARRQGADLGMNDRKKMRWRRELTVALDDAGDGALSLLEYRYVRRVERPHGLPTPAGRRGSGSAPATCTWTTCTKSTGYAQNSTGPRRTRPMNSGGTSAAITPSRSRASSRSGSAYSIWAIAAARLRTMSRRCCGCVAGWALRTHAPARSAPWGRLHDRGQFGANSNANWP